MKLKLPDIKKIKLLESALNKFQTLTSGSEKPTVGIDIGSYAIKIIQFTGSGKNTKIKNWSYTPYQFAQDAPASEKKVAITQMLQELAKKLDLTGKPCAISVSGNSVIIRYVAIAQTNRQDVKKILASEAEPFIPFEVNDVNLDCHLLGDTKQGKQVKTEIILIAAKKDLIKSKIDLINSAKIQPVIVDVDAFALENLCREMNIRGETGGIFILNIGHKLTNISVIEKGLTRVVRDVVTSGQSFTKSIAKACDVDYDTAEMLKKKIGIVPETAPIPPKPEAPPEQTKTQKEQTDKKTQAIMDENKYRAQVSETLKQNMKDLSAEIKRSMDFYYSQGKDRSISKVYITGGSAVMKNLDKFLEKQLNMPVEILNPFGFIEDKKAEEIESDVASSLSVACGLALRKIWDWT
jgi:type IV pilus assembly protein PilM